MLFVKSCINDNRYVLKKISTMNVCLNVKSLRVQIVPFSHPAGLKPSAVAEGVVKTPGELAALQKLGRILWSKTFSPSDFKVGVLVQDYVCHFNQKKSQWLSPLQLNEVDPTAEIITVSGFANEKVMAAVKDPRAAFSSTDFSEFVIPAIVELGNFLELEIDQYNSRRETTSESYVSDDRQILHDDEFVELSKENSIVVPNVPDPSVGDHIKVFLTA